MSVMAVRIAIVRTARVLAAFCIAVVAALIGPGAAHAQTVSTYSNSTDGTISDTSTPCNARMTRTFSVGQTFRVTDVNIGVLAAHTTRGDMQMYLVSPQGTRVQLTPGSGTNAGDNFNALYDDSAAAAISTYTANAVATATTVVPPYAQTFRPTIALSTFNGQNALGTWTLEICDQYSGASGTFYQADLFLTRNPSADLSLTKTVSNAAPAAGSSVSYTLTVTNSSASTDPVSSVSVRDLLPAGVTLTSYTGTGTYDAGTGIWNVGSVAVGQSRSLVINVSIGATAGASITNTAEISASSLSDPDSTPDNGAGGEDDRASVSLAVSGARVAGTPPALTCPIGTLLFDWDTQSWTAGSTAASLPLAGLGPITFGLTNPGVFLNNATYGGQSPTRQNILTGGLASPQYSLMELVDLANVNDVVTTTITLPTAVPGAQMTLFDVDYNAGQFADKVTVTGQFNGAAVVPVLTQGIANYVIGNSAYGDATSTDTQGNGNVVITFNAPVDKIVITYGDHALAPVDPGQQGISLHDITVCKPQANVSVTKISTVISDPVNGTTNPKLIPGAVVEYCITITNGGSATMTSLAATDPLPATMTYTAASLKSGASCAAATTAEDDNNTGTDESDPFGAAISGTTISAAAATLGPSSAFALKYMGTVN